VFLCEVLFWRQHAPKVDATYCQCIPGDERAKLNERRKQKLASKDGQRALKYARKASSNQAIDIIQRNGRGITSFVHPSTRFCGPQADILANAQGPTLQAINTTWRNLARVHRFAGLTDLSTNQSSEGKLVGRNTIVME